MWVITLEVDFIVVPSNFVMCLPKRVFAICLIEEGKGIWVFGPDLLNLETMIRSIKQIFSLESTPKNSNLKIARLSDEYPRQKSAQKKTLTHLNRDQIESYLIVPGI